MLFPSPVPASAFLFIVSRFPPPLQAVKAILCGSYAHVLYEECAHLNYSFWEDLHSALLLELPVTCPSQHLSLDPYHFSPELLQMFPSLLPCSPHFYPSSLFLGRKAVPPLLSGFVCWPLPPFLAMSPASCGSILCPGFRNYSLCWR